MAAQKDGANYLYWRQHGHEWAEEYDQRKKYRPCYHLQELMLVEYVSHHAPLKVLEFGCGVGRHLRNIRQIPGVEAFGYDQSPSMVAECLRWAEEEWLEQHVTAGPPVARLPYEDGQFDLVFTAEVLVHVAPADLPAVLGELLRVARRQVFHLEPSPGAIVDPAAHDGCWNHDLATSYRQLTYVCEVLPSGYAAHTPYRVVLDGGGEVWWWSTAGLAVLRRLETDLEVGMATLRGPHSEHTDTPGARVVSRLSSILGLGPQGGTQAASVDCLLDRVEENAFALRRVQHSLGHRALCRWQRGAAGRWIQKRLRGAVSAEVRILGHSNPASKGQEVWVMRLGGDRPNAAVPWESVDFSVGWSPRRDPRGAYGTAMLGNRGSFRFAVMREPEIQFLTHPWSGIVQVRCQGRAEIIDLYSPEAGSLVIRPASSPMRQQPPSSQHK